MNAAYPPNSPSHPSWIEHTIAIGITLLILEQHSRLPEANFMVVIVAFLATFSLIVAFCMRFSVRVRSSGDDLKHSVWRMLHWCVLPAAVFLMLTSAATHWPAIIRFALSRASFEQLVSKAENGDEPQGFPRRVGLYWVERIHDYDFDYESGQGRIGFVTGVALIDECGIYHDSADRRSSHYLNTRIAPGWYITEW